MNFLFFLYVLTNVNRGAAVYASTIPSSSKQPLINIDAAQFKGSEPNMARCEIYVGFPCYVLSYQKDSVNKFSAKFKINVTIKNDSGKIIDEGTLDRTSFVNSIEEAKTKNSNILEQMEIMLPPGKYNVEIDVTQADMPMGETGSTGMEMVQKTSHWKASREIEIRKPEKGFSISDIQLSIEIDTTSATGKFSKNGLNIIPLPQASIGEPYQTLYAYSEIYNLKNNDKYGVKYSVVNEADSVVLELQPKIMTARATDVTEIEAIKINNMEQGTYTLKAEILRGKNKILNRKTFTVSKLFKKQPSASKEDLEYAGMIEYIATLEEMKIYNNLSNTGKQTFITEFWKKRGADSLRDFVEKLKYADANFSSYEEKGRDSDVGRIWIKYGKPTDIERFMHDPTYNNAEKWTYYKNEGIVFIFVDKSGYGKYRLVYSSIKDEITDPNYKKLISPDFLQ